MFKNIEHCTGIWMGPKTGLDGCEGEKIFCLKSVANHHTVCDIPSPFDLYSFGGGGGNYIPHPNWLQLAHRKL